MNEKIGERKEKIESKGAYAYDLHKAIRDVHHAFTRDDLESVGLCLDALLDICAPEIREAIVEEWNEIDEKYRPVLKKIKNAEFRAKYHKSGWYKDRDSGKPVYCVDIGDSHIMPSQKKRIVENTRHKLLRKVWKEIYHERLQACIDCLDRHGELRKWREVEYGKL